MDEQAEAIEYGYPEHFWYATLHTIMVWECRCICGESWTSMRKKDAEWGLAFHVDLNSESAVA